MSLTAGTRLGPYEVVAPIGAGGMGEVVRARDTRLDRDVAIKVLPESFTSDPDRRARFEREAKAIAALSHPNILAVYDTGVDDDRLFVVTELLEGDTLRERLSAALPVRKAIDIASQMSRGLAAAHAKGIVHRDLKPENVFLTRDGQVKILDFGLARQVSADTGETETVAAMTDPGTVLGTVGYMAPEQVRGQLVDARADLFALGAVLYEMLTGRRAFQGDTAADTMFAVVKEEPPDPTSLRSDLPPALERIVRHCLEKSPTERFQTARDVAFALESLSGSGVAATLPVPHPPADTGPSMAPASISRSGSSRQQAIRWVAAGLVGGLLAAAGWSLGHRAAPPLVPMQVQVGFAPAEAILGSVPLEVGVGGGRPSRTALALSPDGRWLVFAGTRAGEQQLFLRDLTRDEASPIDGTKGGDSPFFSPDGEWVGFWADEALRKVPLGGGPVTEICKTSHVTGASWGDDGRVLFAEGGVLKACMAGREAEVVAAPDREAGETSYRLPFLLPGGRDLLFTIVSGRAVNSAKVAVRSLTSGEQRIVMENASDGRYAPSGHLVFIRLGTLMAAPFDAGRLEVTAPAVGIVENVMAALNMPNTQLDSAAGQFTFSAAGHLVYLAGGMFPDVVGTLVWLDREGRVTPLDTAPRGYMSPQLSPDGQRIVVQSVTGVERAVWVIDITRGTASKLQFDGLAEWPIWTPDGQRVVFSGSTEGIQNLYWMRADGSDRAERLTTNAFNQLAASWSADGQDLIFVEERRETRDDIYALSMADRTTRPILENPAGETHPAMSPDGRWLAYVSDDSGRPEVFVMAYRGPVGRVQVSVAGGSNPRWTRDGRALVFSAPVQDGIRTIMSVSITTTPALAAAVPRRIMAVSSEEFSSTTPIAGFDIAADGRLIGATRKRPSAEPPPATFKMLLNWTARLVNQ